MQRYDITLRILHWLIAIAILGMIGFGWWLEGLPSNDASKLSLIMLHKSLGITILILVIGRISMRLLTTIPPLPAQISKKDKTMAHLGHALLYVLMIITPISGYIMSMASIYGVEWFGIKLYNYIGTNPALAEAAYAIHEIVPYVLLGVIGLHVAAVIKHKYSDKPPIDLMPRISLTPSKD